MAFVLFDVNTPNAEPVRVGEVGRGIQRVEFNGTSVYLYNYGSRMIVNLNMLSRPDNVRFMLREYTWYNATELVGDDALMIQPLDSNSVVCLSGETGDGPCRYIHYERE